MLLSLESSTSTKTLVVKPGGTAPGGKLTSCALMKVGPIAGALAPPPLPLLLHEASAKTTAPRNAKTTDSCLARSMDDSLTGVYERDASSFVRNFTYGTRQDAARVLLSAAPP